MQRKRVKNVGVSPPPPRRPRTFLQSLDLVHPKNFLTVFGGLSQSVCELCERKGKFDPWVGQSGTYKLALLQALSLTGMLA